MTPLTAGNEELTATEQLAITLLMIGQLPRRSPLMTECVTALGEIGDRLSRNNAHEMAVADTGLDRAVRDSFVAHGSTSSLFEDIADRSAALAPDDDEARCHCGTEAIRYRRRARVAFGVDTEQTVCRRCGDVNSRTDDAPALHLSGPIECDAGASGWVQAEFVATRRGTYQCGVAVRSGWACTVSDNQRSVAALPGEHVTVRWDYEVDSSAPSEAQYFRPIAVSGGHVSAGRFHVFCVGDRS